MDLGMANPSTGKEFLPWPPRYCRLHPRKDTPSRTRTITTLTSSLRWGGSRREPISSPTTLRTLFLFYSSETRKNRPAKSYQKAGTCSDSSCIYEDYAQFFFLSIFFKAIDELMGSYFTRIPFKLGNMFRWR